MEKKKINVIIPTYRPGKEFPQLLKSLRDQKCQPDRVIIMNTEKEYWKKEWEDLFPGMEIFHLKKEEFDHGGTRRKGAELSDGDILIFMTQDAIPFDHLLIGNLVRPLLEEEKTGAAYGRQLPQKGCSFLERYTRSFNYPENSYIKKEEDIPRYGIKTFFCSNVCAAYKRTAYEEIGGFVQRAIFNEDMICAGNMIKHGYSIAYAADARVLHSHNYSCAQQFHRNFDLGVSQAEHPEIFANIPSEGEGFRLVKKTFCYLLKTGHIWLIPQLIFQSGFKYIGYFLGKRYEKLPEKFITWATMNKSYWKKK